MLAGVTTVSSTGAMSIPSGPTSHRGGRGRGIIGGGAGVTMNYITIATTGNALDFGDLVDIYAQISAAASSTRGVFSGGSGPTAPTGGTRISYTTISSKGGSSDFGDLRSKKTCQAPMSDGVRGLFAGGYGAPAATKDIDMVTIASTGGSTNWGDLTFITIGTPGGCASPTRGLVFGGDPGAALLNTIDYITIATQGEGGKNFGDLSYVTKRTSAASNSTRGITFG